MSTQQAIVAFSQSEKIKAGIIWISQVLGVLPGLRDQEKSGAEKIAKTLLGMLAQEIKLAKNVAADASWDEAERYLDQAGVMINSGVAAESITHLTKALSQVTGVGQRSMTLLKEQGLL